MDSIMLIILGGAVVVFIILIIFCYCVYQRRRFRAKDKNMLRNAVSWHVTEDEDILTDDEDDIEANSTSLDGITREGVTPRKVHEMANRVNELRNKNITLRRASKLP